MPYVSWDDINQRDDEIGRLEEALTSAQGKIRDLEVEANELSDLLVTKGIELLKTQDHLEYEQQQCRGRFTQYDRLDESVQSALELLVDGPAAGKRQPTLTEQAVLNILKEARNG